MNRQSLSLPPLLDDLVGYSTSALPDTLRGLEPDPTFPSTFRASALIEQLTIEALGDENLAFLKLLLGDRGISSPSHKELLQAAADFASSDTQRNAMAEFIERYVEIVDFEGKLELPRKDLIDESGATRSIVTRPQGESVYLIERSLETMIDSIQTHSIALGQLKEEIAIARISRLGASPNVPSHVALDPVSEPPEGEPGRGAPVSSTQKGGSGRALFDLGSLSLKALGQLAKELRDKAVMAVGLVAAIMTEVVERGKQSARPGQNRLRDLFQDLNSRFSLFDFKVTGDGLENTANQALGLLSPRMERSRYAQTGSPDKNGDGGYSAAQLKDALLRFTLDLGSIKDFFASNKHIKGNLPSFFTKEAQVVIDREGKIERLDSFLSRSEAGRQLSSAFYQPRLLPSTPREKVDSVTIPIIPLVTTSLPVPPGMFISALEYLNARGERIEQAETNNVRACVAGGALVNAPFEARIVRYSVESDSPYGRTKSPHAPTPLTADQFQRFQSLLPVIDFELGNEGRLAYKAINQFHKPETRFNLANAYEAQRSWSYSMDGGIIEFQRQAGTAFLESVYNMRAGICDSMSTVGAHVFGSALGFSGLVLSGPVQSKGNFDLRTGHSINGSILPTAAAHSDLTKLAEEDGISTGRVPAAARRMLRDILNDKQATRSDVAEAYGDLGDLMRGEVPDRFHAQSGISLRPRSVLQDYFRSFNKADAKSRENTALENFTGMDSWAIRESYDRLSWIKLGYQLDEVISRSKQSGSGSELLWLIDKRIADARHTPSTSSVETLSDNLHISRSGAEQLRRFLKHEASRELGSMIRGGALSDSEIESLPSISGRLPYYAQLGVAESLHQSNRNPEIAKLCTSELFKQFLDYLKESRHVLDPALGREFIPRLTKILRESLNHIEPDESKQVASLLEPLLVGTYYLASCHSAEKDAEAQKASLYNLADLLGVVYQAGGKYSSEKLVATLHEDHYSREGFQLMQRHVSEHLKSVLLGETRTAGKEAIEASVANILVRDQKSPAKHLRLLDLVEGLIPDLDFSSHSVRLDRALQNTTNEFIRDHLSGNSKHYQTKYVANWPDDDTPASSLLHENDYSDSAGQGIYFLQRMIQFNGVSENRAREIWPASDEMKHIQTFLEEVRVTEGAINISGSRNVWPLARMPNFFNTISNDPEFPQQRDIVHDTVLWKERTHPIEVHPAEKPLRKIIEMLGTVPPELLLNSEKRSSTVTALLDLAQRDMSPRMLFEAIHAVAPRLMRPADKERLPAHQAALKELAQSLRDHENTPDALKALLAFEPFTIRPASVTKTSLEGAVEAVTILDICNRFSVSLSSIKRPSTGTAYAHILTDRSDDGSSPENQIWKNHFSNISQSSVYSYRELSTAIDRIQALFRSSTIGTRTRLRSPMLTYTLSEEGRINVLGASGTPDDSRRYQPGDSPRNIDWRRSFRNGQDQLVVKVRNEQEERNLTLVADLSVLGKEFSALKSIIESEKKEKTPAITLAKTAPVLATLIHETVVAAENKLKVDLLLTHHAVVERQNDCDKLLLGNDKASRSFHDELRLLAAKSSYLKDSEVKVFGQTRYHPGSPLARHESPLRRASMVHFLPDAPYISECDALAPMLKRQGHLVVQGALPGLGALQKDS